MRSQGQVVLPDGFDPILETALDAVIILDKAGLIVGWNQVAHDTFGWSREQALGRPLADLIVPPEHRAAHRNGMDRLEQGHEPRVLDRRLELPALCKDGSQIPVELSITTYHATGRDYFIGFLRDISDRRRSEDLLRRQVDQLSMLLEVTQKASEAEGFEAAMRTALKAICDSTGWQAGHAFLVDRNDPDRLTASMIWHEQTPGCAAAISQASEGLVFRRGEGLPGEVLERDGPVWLSDINLEGNFIRQGFEFRGAFGFPLRSRGRVFAVLEFFSQHPTSPDKTQLLLAQALGSQVGQAIERSETNAQRELLLHEISHRNKNLLTVMQSMARITFKHDAVPDHLLATFTDRIAAMARAHDLLINHQWSDSTMRETVDTALEGFASYRDRFTVTGPTCPIRAEDVQSNVLIIHELCTNALKYGALAVEDGRIEIEWGFCGSGEAREFVFRWQEFGCALGAPPERRGFGSSLLQRGFGPGSGVKVDIAYEPGGLRYRLTAPAPLDADGDEDEALGG